MTCTDWCQCCQWFKYQFSFEGLCWSALAASSSTRFCYKGCLLKIYFLFFLSTKSTSRLPFSAAFIYVFSLHSWRPLKPLKETRRWKRFTERERVHSDVNRPDVWAKRHLLKDLHLFVLLHMQIQDFCLFVKIAQTCTLLCHRPSMLVDHFSNLGLISCRSLARLHLFW